MARGIALCVGVTEADASTYGKKLTAAGAADSVAAMHRLAQSRGFDSTLLTSARGPLYAPRLQTFSDRIREAARDLNGTGGTFLLAFSGHGALRRRDELEPHGWDEAWCLQDGPLLDDDLYDLLTDFDASVQIWVISDSCHSGTMVDRETAPAYAARSPGAFADSTRPRGPSAVPKHIVSERRTPVDVSSIRPMLWGKQGRRRGGERALRPLMQAPGLVDDAVDVGAEGERALGPVMRAPVLCLSACQDGQSIACPPSLSASGLFEASNSFLNKIEKIWEECACGTKPYPGTCNQFCQQVVSQATKPGQNPNRYWLNEALNFGAQRPAFPQYLSNHKPYTRALLRPASRPDGPPEPASTFRRQET